MTKEIRLKNGSVMVAVLGYSGEDDFYAMYDVIKELLQPEHITYGVDSMCVDGSFRKNGILVRMSSECVTDDCCFHYDEANMSPEEVELVKGWIREIVTELHKVLPR